MCILMLDILKYKPRVPVGKTILELPAGMLDDDKGDFVGTAVREVYFSLILTISSWTQSTCFTCIPSGFLTCMSEFLVVFPSDMTVLTVMFWSCFETDRLKKRPASS